MIPLCRSKLPLTTTYFLSMHHLASGGGTAPHRACAELSEGDAGCTPAFVGFAEQLLDFQALGSWSPASCGRLGSTCSPVPLSLCPWHKLGTRKMSEEVTSGPQRRDKALALWGSLLVRQERPSSLAGRCGPGESQRGLRPPASAPHPGALDFRAYVGPFFWLSGLRLVLPVPRDLRTSHAGTLAQGRRPHICTAHSLAEPLWWGQLT